MKATLELASDAAAMERVRRAQPELAAAEGTSGRDTAELIERRRRG